MNHISRHPLVRAVERAAKRERLFERGETVLVAVSGGADSTVLLLSVHALARVLGIAIQVAHLDHGWRGEDARADAAFVEALAVRLGVPFHSGTADAAALARAERLSPEDAARRLRYEFLRDRCRELDITTVATGHTQDDQLETALLAWLRGSGPAGLAGMSWRGPLPAPQAGNLCVVRPLLDITRGQIRDTLRALNQPWREDITNEDPRLLRNRVRHELVPLLESLNPGYRKAMLRSIELTHRADRYLQDSAAGAAAQLFARDGERRRAARAALMALDPALRPEVLRWAVAQVQGDARDVEWAHIEGALAVVARGRGNATAWLAPHLRLRVERGQVVIELVIAPENRAP